MSSVSNSIQSPVSRQVGQYDLKKKRASISDESTNASHAHNFQGRRTYNPKVQKKAIKKVINIPSVKIDKQMMKAQKKSRKAEKMYDMMDTIPENQDFSEIDSVSVITKTHFKEDAKERKSKKSENGNRKVVISKINKGQKDSAKKGNKVKIDKPKTKKVKKCKNKERQGEQVNHSINMRLCDNSITNDSYVNKSYQQNDIYQEQYFRSVDSQVTSVQKERVYEKKINSEIEYEPIQHPEPTPLIELTETKAKEWENLEMFSSKKFSEIIKKHKKVTRYHDSIDNDEESFMDLQSNRKSNAELQVDDIFDDERDLGDHRTYQNGNHNQKIECRESPAPETFDRIKKVEMSDIKEVVDYSRELKFEDLTSSIKKSAKRLAKEQSAEPSASKGSEHKIFTTSINLMDFDALSAEKLQEEYKNSKTQDCRDDSLEKAPTWNFIGSNREQNYFEGPSTSKKVIIDDFDEFKYDDPPSEQEEEQRQDTDNVNAMFDTSEANNSCYINEELGDDEQYQKLENVSVFEENEEDQDNDDQDNIPFNLDDEQQDDNDQYTQQTEEGIDTLKQMRMLFGSEQKIREQSEAAIQNLNNADGEEQEEIESEPDEFQTPGLSQSIHEHNNGTAKSNVFDRRSFQDFSMKKFQEIMFENNISDFMSSVERTVRQNNTDNQTHRTHREEKHSHEKAKTPKKSSHFVSPRKFSRKELELDRIVGSKMKYMSEKKKQRRSMLDNDSSLVKEITQDPLNKSMDIYKSKFANYTQSNKSQARVQKPKMVGSDINIPINNGISVQNQYNKVEIERTEQV